MNDHMYSKKFIPNISQDEIHTQMKSVPPHKIHPGLSIFALCLSKTCENSTRLKIYNLGYGSQTKKSINNFDTCDKCKHHKSVPAPLLTVGIALKDSYWVIDDCETIWNEPNPHRFKKFEKSKRKIVGVQKFSLKDTILDQNSYDANGEKIECMVRFRVKPVDLRLCYRDPRFINIDSVKA